MKAYVYALQYALAACVGLCWLAGCSVDEFSHPQRLDSETCRKRGGTPITAKFCRFGAADAGGMDAGNGSEDAGPKGEPCGQDGRTQELCYEGADPNTSLQPPCRAGSRTCRDGVWGPCEKQVLPAAESCNGQDDDCDGRVDEQLDATQCEVESAKGRCRGGMLLCLAGVAECIQVQFARTDVCNGEDDDCDGSIDEHTALVCYEAADGCEMKEPDGYVCRGLCTAGTRACVNGEYEEDCRDSVTPAAHESCTDAGGIARDEDCDGQVDEGCSCTSGATCYTGSPPDTALRSPCHTGTQVCRDATHGDCTGEVTPRAEDCANEGTDDDCDGVMDDVLERGASCAGASNGKGACKANARIECRDGKATCVDAEPVAEVCDGQDDVEGEDEDCDGKVDEGFMFDSDPQNCGKCGVRCGAGTQCCGGHCVNPNDSKDHCGGCGRLCAGSNTCCDGTCTNTTTDGSNCGMCGNVCGLLLGCKSGNCRLL